MIFPAIFQINANFKDRNNTILSRSLDLPATEGVDALAQELAKLQDNGEKLLLGSRHVPVVDIHLIELIARSLAEEGHNILTSGSQGVNAVIRAVIDINP